MRANRLLVQAPPVDTVPVRVAPGHVERTDAAGAAEPVLCGFGVESVF